MGTFRRVRVQVEFILTYSYDFLPFSLPLGPDLHLLGSLRPALLLGSVTEGRALVTGLGFWWEHCGTKWAYDAIREAEELLFLLLSLLKMSLDQSLQFRQVLLHALAVNVL